MARRVVVVVVGATGQISRPLCPELVRTGRAVSVFSRDPARARKLVHGAADYVELDGPVNLTAPGPVRARQFARALGGVLGHRAWLPVPAHFVRMGMGAVTDILARGQRVLPAKVSAAGYQFRFPALEAALRDIVYGEAGQ